MAISDCTFTKGRAQERGDDIYIEMSQSPTILIRNITSRGFSHNSIYCYQTSIAISQVLLENNTLPLENGGGIHCLDCYRLTVEDATLKGLKAQRGGAIQIIQSPERHEDIPDPDYRVI